MSAAAKAQLKKMGAGGKTSATAGAQPWIEPYTLTQIQQLAQQLTQAALLPQQQAIGQAQAQYMGQAEAQQATIGDYAQQAAGQLAEIGPRVQGVYQDAAEAQAGFAKGFSDGLRLLAEQQAAEQARILQGQGAPAEQITQLQGLSGDAGAGDALYGLGGYLPAASLGREGAAWAAATGAMPSVALAQGRQDLAAAQWQAAEQGKQFQAQLADLAARAPGIFQETVQSLLGNEREKWAARLAAEQFGFDVQQQQWENQYQAATDAAGAAGDAAGERDAQRRDREDAQLAFKQLLAKSVEDFVTPEQEIPNPDYDPNNPLHAAGMGPPEYITRPEQRPHYKKVVKAILKVYAAEIKVLSRRYNISQQRIRRLIREVLEAAGWKITPTRGAGPMGEFR